MKLLILPIVFILFSIFLLSSCEFKPDGDNYRDINTKPAPVVVIAIEGHSDTLIATSNQNYAVQVTCGKRSVLFYRLSIDGTQKKLQTVNFNNFYIDPFSYINKDGIYRMTVEAGINTGSGSIADVIGAEGYLFSKDFILVVLRQQVPFYPEVQTTRTNHSMKVSLDVPSNITNVKKVVFSRSIPGGGQTEIFASVLGSNHYESMDPYYVGQNTNYLAATYIGDPGGMIFVPYASGSGYSNTDLPHITAGVSARGFPEVKWNKTRYSANFGSYRIYERRTGASEYGLLASIGNISDTSYEVLNFTFPGYSWFRVAPVPALVPGWFNDEIAINYFSTEAYSVPGLTSFYFSRFVTPASPFLYFTNTSNEINEFSTETGQITKVISTSTGSFYTFSVSPNGRYLLAANGMSNFSYLFYDLVTQQQVWIPGAQVIGAGSSTGIISISDNGTASIVTGNRVVVYDFLHQNSVTSKTFTPVVNRTVISPDGNYLFVYTNDLTLYHYESGAMVQKWSVSGTSSKIKYFSFYPGLPVKAFLYLDQTCSTLNCEIQVVEKLFPLDLGNICNVDFESGYILGKTDYNVKVYDMSGIQQYQNLSPGGSNYSDLRIRKNTIYSTGGKKIIIF